MFTRPHPIWHQFPRTGDIIDLVGASYRSRTSDLSEIADREGGSIIRRIKLVLAVATVMVAMLVAASGPAMADVVFDDGSGVVFTSNDGFFPFNPFPDVNNGVSQSSDSGTVNLSFTVSGG